MKISSFRPATLCVHAGTYLDERTGGIGTPIFPSTSYKYPNAADENIYPRYFNVPNQKAVAQKVAALEQAEQGLVFSSGMAAISTTLFAHLKPGDHAVFQADLYGGTHHFISSELAAFGIEIPWPQHRRSSRPQSGRPRAWFSSNPLPIPCCVALTWRRSPVWRDSMAR